MSVGYSPRRDRQSLLVSIAGHWLRRDGAHVLPFRCKLLLRPFHHPTDILPLRDHGDIRWASLRFIDKPFATRVLGLSLNCLSRQAHFRCVLPAVAKDR